MRTITFSLVVMFSQMTVSAQSTSPSADAVLQPVYAKAAKEGKKVLLIFHASWCGWCRKMDASLNDATVKPLLAPHYEIAHLTVQESKDKKNLENPGAEALLEKLGGAEQGLPYWAVLNAKGEALANSQYAPGKNTGCPASKEEVDYFLSVLKKTSLLKTAGLEIIRARMRKNEQ